MGYSTYYACLILICLNLAMIPRIISAKDKPVRSTNQLSKYELGKRYLKLGNTYREAQNYDMSEEYLAKAFNIFKYNRWNYWLAVAYEYYGYLTWDLRDKEAALSNFQEAKIIYDRIINQENGSPEAIAEVIDRLVTMEFNITSLEYPPGPIDPQKDKIGELTDLYTELRKDINAIVTDVQFIRNRLEKLEKKTVKMEHRKQPRYELPPNIIRPLPEPPQEDRTSSFGTNIDGTVIIMPGVGIGSTFGIGEAVFPPSSITINFRISEIYEIGVFSGYSTETYMGGNITYLLYGVRIMYRLYKGDNWDLSSSIMIANNDVKFSGYVNNPSIQALLYGGIADFRYFITNNIGFFVEAGYGVSFMSAGIAMKF